MAKKYKAKYVSADEYNTKKNYVSPEEYAQLKSKRRRLDQYLEEQKKKRELQNRSFTQEYHNDVKSEMAQNSRIVAGKTKQNRQHVENLIKKENEQRYLNATKDALVENSHYIRSTPVKQRKAEQEYRNSPQYHADMKDLLADNSHYIRTIPLQQKKAEQEYQNSPQYHADMKDLLADNSHNIRSYQSKEKQLRKQLEELYKKNQKVSGTGHERWESNKAEIGKPSISSYNSMNANRLNEKQQGIYDIGTNPMYMSGAGLDNFYSKWNQQAADTRKKAEEYRNAGYAGLFDYIEGLDRQNEEAILHGNYTPEQQATADRTLKELNDTYDARKEAAIENGQRTINGYAKYGPEMFAKTMQSQTKDWLYYLLTGDDYAKRTANMTQEQKAELDEQIEKARESVLNYSQDEYDSMLREADADEHIARQVLEEKATRGKIDEFTNWSRHYDSAEYDPSLVETGDIQLNGTTEVLTVKGPKGSREDKAYYYMNNIPESDQYGNTFGMTQKEYFATPEMVDTYNRLFKADKENGTNMAGAFLDAIDPYLSSWKNEYDDNYVRNMSENPLTGIPMRLLSYPMNAINSIPSLINTGMALLGNKYAADPNNPVNQINKLNTTTREEQNKDIDTALGGNGAVEFVLGIADSIGDNLMAMGTSGLVTGDVSSKAGMRVVQLIMSGEATGHTFLEKLEEKKDPTEAAIYAIGDGIIEAITEKYSLEALLSPDVKSMLGNTKQLMKYFGKVSLAEGSEEIASDLLNWGLDNILSSAFNHETELKERYYELIESGMGEQEASRQALLEKFEQIGMSGLAGSISGGLMGMGRAGINYIGNLQAGSQINDTKNIDKMVDIGLRADEGTISRANAEAAQKRITEGKKVRDAEAGKLAQSIMLETNESFSEKSKEARTTEIARMLRAKGMSAADAQSMSETLDKAVMAGGIENLSKAEQRKINNNKAASSVYNKLAYNAKTQTKVNTKIDAATEAEQRVHNAVSSMFTRTQAMGAKYVGRNRATEDDLRKATGTEVKGPMGVIVLNADRFDNAKLTGVRRVNGQIKYTVEIDGKEQTVDASQIRARNIGTAAVIEKSTNDPHLYNMGYTNKLLQVMNTLAQQEQPDALMMDAYRMRMAAYKEQAMPKALINEKAAKELYDYSRIEYQAIRQEETKEANRNALKPGQGTATFAGYQFGTKEFDDALESSNMSESEKEKIRVYAALSKAAGTQVAFRSIEEIQKMALTDEDMSIFKGEENKLYGAESKSGILINLGGENITTDPVTGEKRYSKHDIGVTYGHEFLHFLQRNSLKGYNDIVKYVFDTQAKNKGESWVNRQLENYMRNQDIDLNEAIFEFVADSCDSIFSSKEVIDHIVNTNQTLYGEIKSFIKDLFTRVRAALANMRGSMSEAGAQMINTNYRALGKLVNVAWDEAASGQVITPEEYQQMVAEETGTKTAEEKNKKSQYVWEKYEGESLYKDSSIYDYDFLVALPDIEYVPVQSNISKYITANNETDRINLRKDGLKIAEQYGKKLPGTDGVLITNKYTGRNMRVTGRAITHGVSKEANKKSIANARAGLSIGQLARDAVPINGLKTTEPYVKGTYAMAAPIMRNNNVTGVALLTVEIRTGTIVGIDTFDQIHSANTRKKSGVGLGANTPAPLSTNQKTGSTSTSRSSTMSIKNFLDLVNDTFPDILSVNVLNKLGNANAQGYWQPRKLFSRAMAEDISSMSMKDLNDSYMAAVESGDMEAAQRMADEAANRAGLTDEAYHGTSAFGFTEIDMQKSQDQIFVAYNKEVSDTYSNDSEIKRIGKKEKIDYHKLSGQETVDKYYELNKANLKSKDNIFYLPKEQIQAKQKQAIDEYLSMISKEEWGEYYNTYEQLLDALRSDAVNLDIIKGKHFNTPYDMAKYVLDQYINHYQPSNYLSYTSIMDLLMYRNGVLKNQYNPAEEGRIKEGIVKSLENLLRLSKNENYIGMNTFGGKVTNYYPLDGVQNYLESAKGGPGTYELYTRPGRQLVIDAQRKRWNQIPFDVNRAENNILPDGTYNFKENLEKYDELGLDYPSATTREIGRWAKEHGFDSVRINNVYDHGGRGIAKGFGDIGIFFNQQDVKSADPVTYDDNGDVIPLSERFNDQKKDLRWSRANIEAEGDEVTLDSLNIRRDIYFTGTDSEIDAAEKLLEQRKQEMRDIIEAPDFTALMLKNKPYGRYEILHPSTRKGIRFQLTYYGPDGIPSMHESYGTTGEQVDKNENVHSMDELYKHFADQSFDSKLEMNVLRDNQQNDTRFSRADVEETRDLIAYHNLGPDQLMAVLRLGGFAMPSIAITRDNYVNDRYGDITVLFRKDTIDPKKSSANKVYGGDAWTPVYPTIEYKINDNKVASILKKMKEVLPKELSRNNVDLYSDNIESNVNRNNGNIVEAVKDNTNLMAMFLIENGQEIDYPVVEKRLDGFKEFTNDQVVKVAEAIGEDVIREAEEKVGTYNYVQEHPEIVEQVRKALNDNFNETYLNKETDKKMLSMFKDGLYKEGELSSSAISKIFHAAHTYFIRGIEQEIDKYALKDRLREQIDEKDYKAWLKNLFTGVIEKSGIRNNKDKFTYSGSARSWESLHDEETLENVVRIMKAEADKGANTFFNQSAILALGTRDFKSISDIKAHKEQLQHISDEELSAAKTDIVNRFGNIMDDLADTKREKNLFIARDRVLEAIVDAVRVSRTVDGIKRIMSQWQYNISDEQAQEIADLMVEISNLPTEYFEAKPKRAVGLDEIAKVLVPEGVDQELLDALDDQGIAWEFYDGTSEDRLAKMNANDDVKFSRWTESGMDVNYWMEHATPSMVQTEDERELISMYRGKRTSISLSLKKQGEYRARIRQLEAVENQSTDVKSELTALRNKLEIEKKKVYRLEEEILQITRNDGWAGMMYQHNMVFRDYVEGRTQEQVRQTIDEMLKLVEQTQEQVTKDTENLKKLATRQAVQTMKSFMGKTSMGKMASILRKTYNSTMNKAEIEDRLAEMALKQASGKDITSDTESLAQDLLDKMRGIRTDALESLRGQTFVIGQSLAEELRKENSSIKELQSRIKGSGIKIVTGVKSSTGEIDKHSRISEQWSELRESNAALPDVENMAEIDKLHTIVDFIESELRASTGAEQFGIDFDEVAAMVRASVGNITTYLTDDPKARAQINNLMKQIADLSKATEKTAADMQGLYGQLDDVMQAGARAKGIATAMERDVNEAIKYYNTTARVAAEKERTKVRKALIAQLRDETTQKLLKQQEKYRSMIENNQKARELHLDNEALRRKISTVASRMANRLFAETDQKNVPEETKGLVREVLRMLSEHDSVYRKVTNWDKDRVEDAMKRLNRLNLQNGEFVPAKDLDFLVVKAPNEADNDYTMRDKVWQDILDIESGLEEYRAAETSTLVNQQAKNDALTKVQEALSEIYSVIRARSEAFINGRRYEIATLAEQMENEMAGSKYKGERTGKIGRAFNTIEKMVGYGNLTPEYFFKNLKNGVMKILHGGFHDAEQRAGLEALRAKAVVEKIAKDTKYNTWDPQEKHKVKLPGGREIEMTTEQIMALYATWRRESSQLRPEETAHLLKGGFVLAQGDMNEGLYGRQKNDQRPIRMDKATLEGLRNYLTEDQLRYVVELVNYMSGELAEIGNETSMQQYGIKKFTERYYYPIKAWGGVLNKSSASGIVNKSDARAMRQSFTKNLTANAQNAIEISDFTPTVMKHIVGMITFNTVGPAVENMNKVLNQQLTYGEAVYDENGEIAEDNRYKRNVRAVFQDAYGVNALKYLERFMDDVNGGMTRQQDKSLQEKLLSVFRKGAVAGSLSVAAQQPLSYIRAAMKINPVYLARALAPTHWGKIHDEMLKYSGVAVIKDMGRFDMNQGQSMIDFITPEEKTSKARKAGRAAVEATTILPEKMDALTWGRMWIACKLETAAKNKGMDQKSDEFLQKVAQRFNEVMRQTQVYDSMMVKSQNMRSTNYAIKAMTSFMAEPSLSLNVLADAVRNFNEKGGKLNMGKAAATFIVSAALQALVKAIMSSGRSPDKKKKFEEQFLTKWHSMFMSEVDPLTLIPGYSDIIELFKNGELADDAWGALGKFKTIAQTGIKWATGKSDDYYRSFEDTVGQLAQLMTNVPLKNLMRDGRAIYNFFNPETYAKREYSSAMTKYGIKDSFYTADNMIGLVNSYLQMAGAGYGTTANAYYERIYGAEKAGNKQDAENMREYVLLKSTAEDPQKSMDAGLRKVAKNDDSLTVAEKYQKQKEYGLVKGGSYIKDEYEAGNLTRKEAEKLYRQENPKASDKDVLAAFDKIDYEKKTGKEIDSYSNYMPLYDAISNNRSDEIKAAAKYMMDNGYKAEDIKKQLTTKYKQAYLDAKGSEKTKLMDALTKAYKAIGLTANEALKIINGWKPKKEKK